MRKLLKKVRKLLKKGIKGLKIFKKKIKNKIKNKIKERKQLFEILKKSSWPTLCFFLGWNHSYIFSAVPPFLKSLPSTFDSWLKGNGVEVDLVNPTIWGVPWITALLALSLLIGCIWITVYLCREILIFSLWLFCVCRLVLAYSLKGLQWVYAAFLKWWDSL